MILTTLETPIKLLPLQVDRQQAGQKNGGMNPEQLAVFAERLSKERRTRFKTRSAFCDAAGITRTTLRALENGSQYPTHETIEKLATALRMSPQQLTGEKRIDPDNPLLKDLTEEDLRVAQMFHHAGLAVKQRTLGLMQERQPAHGAKPALEAHVTDWATRLLALPLDRRYAASAVIAAFETPGESSDAPEPLAPDVVQWAKRLAALEENLRGDAIKAIENLEDAQTFTAKKTKSRSTKKRR